MAATAESRKLPPRGTRAREGFEPPLLAVDDSGQREGFEPPLLDVDHSGQREGFEPPLLAVDHSGQDEKAGTGGR